MVLDEWKYFTMENGEQFVKIFGTCLMLKLYAVNLAISMLSELSEGVEFRMAMERYGWIMSYVQATSRILAAALTMGGGIMIAGIMTMLEFNVHL